jgi:hyaluronan synthase
LPPVRAVPLKAAITLGLATFALRRVVFMSAAMLGRSSRRPSSEAGDEQEDEPVCVVMAARDESPVIERTLESLSAARGTGGGVVLVSDGSGDETAAIMERWAAGRPGWKVVTLDVAGGKGAALNAGLAESSNSELVASCDADVRLDENAILMLASAFADPSVGAASALLWPANADRSAVSRYCALELWQHQLITSAAKDRLGLGPPAHGWLACYRREALRDIGGFPAGSLGEDIAISNALLRAGWRTRFVAAAKVLTDVPSTHASYWEQHVRWSHAVRQGGRSNAADAGLTLALRVERGLHAAGYVDRLLFATAAVLALSGHGSRRLPVAYAALLIGEALCALALAGRLRQAPRFVAAAAVMFPVDVGAAATAAAMQLTGRGLARRSRSSRLAAQRT